MRAWSLFSVDVGEIRLFLFKADAIALEGVPEGCDAAFAGFWWSHIRKSELRRFVANLAARRIWETVSEPDLEA